MARKVTFASFLPRVGQTIRLTSPALENFLFDTAVTGQGPTNYVRNTMKKLPNEDIVITEAIFYLAAAPADIYPAITHTATGWQATRRNDQLQIVIAVEII